MCHDFIVAVPCQANTQGFNSTLSALAAARCWDHALALLQSMRGGSGGSVFSRMTWKTCWTGKVLCLCPYAYNSITLSTNFLYHICHLFWFVVDNCNSTNHNQEVSDVFAAIFGWTCISWCHVTMVDSACCRPYAECGVLQHNHQCLCRWRRHVGCETLQ